MADQISILILCSGVVKPEGARWMISMYDYLKGKPEIISNGFKDCLTYHCITSYAGTGI